MDRCGKKWHDLRHYNNKGEENGNQEVKSAVDFLKFKEDPVPEPFL